MIHEDLNCSFLEKERNFSALKYFKLHDAVELIYLHIFELLQTASNRSDTIDILKWGINLCFDLIHFNQRRMKVAKPSMQAENFKHTESGARLLHFLEKVFVFMLQHYPDESFYTLVIFSDTHRPVEERQFEWLMNFFLDLFSTSVISRFISYCGNKIRRICKDNSDPLRAEGIFNQLFFPLIPIMVILQQSRQTETNDAIEKLLDSFIKGKLEDNFDVIFILR
uniref:Uncharacterized protein n=1 Tax=Panagrolaimus sp. ES5 TaxID=591445 RepID=A0AC34GC40_9BILA